MNKRRESALRREAARLIREGKMPSLETLCEAIVETRTKYANKIRRARRDARENVAAKIN
jgi:hypothetical protein